MVDRALFEGAQSKQRPDLGWVRLPYDSDKGPAPRAAIGVLTLASDIATEAELREFLPPEGVGVYASRIPRARASTLTNLRSVEGHITEAMERLVPDDHLDVVAFSCTSGTAAIGAERVAELIRRMRPGVRVTDPLTAARNGLRALGVERLALLTPYHAQVNEVIADAIARGGPRIVVRGGFFCESGYEMSRIAPRSIVDAALAIADRTDVDGVLISCTALRVAAVIEEMESALGKAVVFSTQAMAWEALRLSGVTQAVPRRGRLLRL